jgi:methyl-accepting chemotaxis protein
LKADFRKKQMLKKMNPAGLTLADKMSVSARLAIAFGMMICMLVVGAAMGLTSLSGLNQKLESQSTSRTPALILAGRLEVAIVHTTRHMRNALILSDADKVKVELAVIRADQQARAGMTAELSRLVTSDQAKGLLQGISGAAQAYGASETEFLRLADAGSLEEAKKELVERASPAEDRYVDAINKFVNAMAEESREASRDASSTYENSRNVMAVLSALAIVLAAVVAYLFSRRLRVQLGGEPTYAALVASSIAHGDLSMTVNVRSGDESSLLHAMEQMTVSLRQLVGEVANRARVVAETSEQIAQGNVDLSQRTEEQASTLEETASSMEELTSTVLQNAESAKQANQLAVGASEVARKGGHAVGQVVSTMTAISESSRKIADIIAVIDSIAFQTNILALNAAVEAARAGEQGRGFAVVAAEVRNLAQRSAAAAKEIKTLISDSVDKVDAGTRLVDAAGKTMDEIVGAVKGVTDLIAEIAAASQEQSSGIAQVNQAVTQMEQVVQQNASLVEEATAATESMKDQAGALLQTVSRFKLNGEQHYSDVHEVDGWAPSQEQGQPRGADTWNERPTPLRGGTVTALGAPKARASASGEWQEF